MKRKDRTWAFINLENIKENYLKIKEHSKTKVMCVIKADAYGHGLLKVAKTLETVNADFFGVATLHEALSLRENGIKTPILLLGYFENDEACDVISNDITATIYDIKTAEILSNEAKKLDTRAKVHIKIDSGMSRLGFLTSQTDEILSLCELENLEIEGIYTHLASADNPWSTEFTYKQVTKFNDICDLLESNGVEIAVKHVSATSASLQYEDLRYDMIRLGIGLFGYYPDEKIEKTLNLRPAMSLYSTVAQVKTIKKGDTVSYGRRFEATEDMKIAILTIGYADGFTRANKNDAYVLVNGWRAKILGSICMDMCVVDVTEIEVLQGDKVVIFDEENLKANEVSEFSGTIVYEVLCGVSKRVPRIYSGNK